ncbi:MAG: T9SS type A sorting domain-containing protein [Saprospiraceae bacterium]|nr:T9SS type A sorting domain-containing protein [Saprospiraceae bacterium]
MNTFRLIISFTIALVPASLRAQGLQVWPGDANNNGVVNHVDLLQVGLAYNYFGPARDSTFVGWQAQTAPAWTQTAGSGPNAAYADADGNGLVNYFYDAFPIFVHYGFTHGTVQPDVFPQGLPGIDPPLFLDESALPPQVLHGMALSLPLQLGTGALPVEDLYGLAFSLHVDPQFVDVDEVEVNLGPVSWANPDNDRIYSAYRASSSRLDVAWVRTDHNDRSGFGPMGTVSIVIIDNVVSVQEEFQLRIDSILLVDRFGNLSTVAGDTLTISINPGQSTGTQDPGAKAFRAWPNPLGQTLHLRARSDIRMATLFDALGRPVASLEPNTPDAEWPLPVLPAGVYWLELRTDDQLFRQKMSRH